MKTLRPYDFYTGDDIQAEFVGWNGLLTIRLPYSGDSMITSVIKPEYDWSGDTVKVQVCFRFTNISIEDTMLMRLHFRSYPAAESMDSVTEGEVAEFVVKPYSPNPAIISSDEIAVKVPDGYTPDRALTLVVTFDPAESTTDIMPDIALVKYKFA